MNTKMLSLMAAGFALAGCSTCKLGLDDVAAAAADFAVDAKDPVVGNWGLKLGYDSMNAGHMIVSRDAGGKPQALVLWRWASPIQMKNVALDGARITFDHPWGFKVEGEVAGNVLTAKAVKKDGSTETTVEGWRNPAIKAASTKDAKFGAPIDLLKDGLDGWTLMNPKAKNGWSFKDGVLSNALGLKPDGKWAGGGSNLMTKRADFYDFNLEYDVRVPAKSNSGVYLRGRYECQVVDSYGQSVNEHNMAAYYGRVVPKVAAEKKPGEWQHVSVTLFMRHLTVVLNGVTIIEDAPVVGVTGGAIDANEFVPGPIYLQGDHSDADFKNMILRPAVNSVCAGVAAR